jgi:sugar phosphate isomerase/epimerase
VAGASVPVGIDGREGPAAAALERARRDGLDGVLFRTPFLLSPTLDPGELRAAADDADEQGLYLELGAGWICPYDFERAPATLAAGDGDYRRGFERVVRACASIDRRELLSFIGTSASRTRTDVAWERQLAAAREFALSVAPLLRDLGVRLNLETHVDATTFELVRLIEEVGPDVLGVTLDTANLLTRCEHPTAGAERVAPYVHPVHAKDAIVFFDDRGLVRQPRPCGQGVVDWTAILPLLFRHDPNLRLTLEDHQGRSAIPIFEPDWLRLQPELGPLELAAIVELARGCERRIASGEIAGPDAYDAVPYAEQRAGRRGGSAAHLRWGFGATVG